MIASTILSFFLAVISHSLLPYAHWNHAIPDLAVLYLALLAMSQPRRELIPHAFAVGVIWDLYAGHWFGYEIFSLVVFALFLQMAQTVFYMSRPLIFFPVVFLGGLFRQLSLGLLMALRGLSLGGSFWQQALSSTLYSVMLALFLYILYRLLEKVWKQVT